MPTLRPIPYFSERGLPRVTTEKQDTSVREAQALTIDVLHLPRAFVPGPRHGLEELSALPCEVPVLHAFVRLPPFRAAASASDAC